MSADTSAIDEAVATYRARMRDASDVCEASLDEIEDHMRALIADLRSSGTPLARAIREAAERMGEPATLAREHGRVETSFGARLPAWRAWTGAAALLVPVAMIAHYEKQLGGDAMSLVKVLPLVIMVAGLAARATWARPLVLAQATCWATDLLFYRCVGVTFNPAYVWLPFALIAIAMTAPWRHREMKLAGWGLFLAYVGFERLSRQFVSAAYILERSARGLAPDVTLSHGLLVAGIAASLIAMAAIILRTKWAALPAAYASIATALCVPVQLPSVMHSRMPVLAYWFIGHLVFAAVASSAAAIIAWRTARKRFNSNSWRTA